MQAVTTCTTKAKTAAVDHWISLTAQTAADLLPEAGDSGAVAV
jgi:hypothetical protein